LQSLAHNAFSLINDAARKSRRRISTLGLPVRIITLILEFTVAIGNASPFSITVAIGQRQLPDRCHSPNRLKIVSDF
jgi:hypothetical protein